MDGAADTWRPEPLNAAAPGPPDIPREPMEFLSRSWSVSALEVSKALLVNHSPVAAAGEPIAEEVAGEVDDDVAAVAGSQFTFSLAATSQLVMERIMSQSEASPRTCGRLSNSSGSLTVGGQCGGSLTDSPPFSPSVTDDIKIHYGQTVNTPVKHARASKTVGRWLKDRRQRKKDEARVLNAELHAAISVAGVAAAVAAIAAATAAASASGKDDRAARTDLAVASAATLVASQCVEVAESMGAQREILAAVVGSAVSVRTHGDIVTLTAAAATALRGAATLKARTLKDEWNLAAVTPVEKGGGAPLPNRHEPTKQKYTSNYEGPVKEVEWTGNFIDLCNQDLLARGAELLKRTRKGSLHWKTVSVYINQMGQVMLKMKSSHVAGTFIKKKKSVIIGVCKDIPAWPGRHLLEGGERRRYFGLRTSERRVIEFECKGQKEYEMWTQGVSRLIVKTRSTC